MEVKINKSIGFDRMSITAKFPSGANFRYFIGRSGEKLETAFSNDPAIILGDFILLMV
jgi:hypothetical protein